MGACQWELYTIKGLYSTRFLGPALLIDNPRFHPLHNLAKWGVQRVGDLPETTHRRVDNASFYTANIRPIEPALATKSFLRLPGLFAEFTHDDPDGFCLQIGRLDLPLTPLHGQIRWW